MQAVCGCMLYFYTVCCSIVTIICDTYLREKNRILYIFVTKEKRLKGNFDYFIFVN